MRQVHCPTVTTPRQRRDEPALTPIANELMLALFDYLEDCLDISSCDHAMSHTEAFLIAHGLSPAPAVNWLRRLGPSCDCEVLETLELTWSVEDEAPRFRPGARGGA